MPPHMSDGICTRYQPHDERRIACRGRILACMLIDPCVQNGPIVPEKAAEVKSVRACPMLGSWPCLWASPGE